MTKPTEPTLKKLRQLYVEERQLQAELAALKLEMMNHPLKPGVGETPDPKWMNVSREGHAERAEIVAELQAILLEIAEVRTKLRDDPLPMESLLYVIDSLVNIEAQLTTDRDGAWDNLSLFIDGLEKDEERIYNLKENRNG